MMLTQAQMQIVADRINQKVGPQSLLNCSTCGTRDRAAGEMVFEMREFSKGDFIVGSAVAPFVATVCKTCGQTTFYSAGVLGLVDPATGNLTI